ncbi:STAS domain-containing protein [Streptomyces sp. NPDC048192]|uniref:STAS domain-containing protein n=1 Tax=Streptomyces sp. NPDC048192 TaxID=3365510 RepID=UPI003723D359
MNDFQRFRSAITDEGDTITVAAFGEMDLGSVEDLHKTVVRCLQAAQVQHLVVDMSQVAFCDCSGLGALIEARESALRRGVSFHLTEVKTPVVMRLLTLTGTTTLFGLNRPA